MSSAAGRIAAVALVPVNIVGNAFAQVAAVIVAVTPTPIRIVVGWVWTFVPSVDSPFVVVIMVVQFASDIQWYKRMANLLWKTMTGSGREAACNLCDEVVVCFMQTYVHDTCMHTYIHTCIGDVAPALLQIITTVMDLEDTKDGATYAHDVRTHECMYLCMCMYACMYICIYACIYVDHHHRDGPERRQRRSGRR